MANILNEKEQNFVIKDNNYLEGGTKAACVTLRQLIAAKDKRPITLLEENAIGVLLASIFVKPDEIPKRFICDDDCKYTANLLCKGEMCIAITDEEMHLAVPCPYFTDW